MKEEVGKSTRGSEEVTTHAVAPVKASMVPTLFPMLAWQERFH
jgi:hypothetical protein